MENPAKQVIEALAPILLNKGLTLSKDGEDWAINNIKIDKVELPMHQFLIGWCGTYSTDLWGLSAEARNLIEMTTVVNGKLSIHGFQAPLSKLIEM